MGKTRTEAWAKARPWPVAATVAVLVTIFLFLPGTGVASAAIAGNAVRGHAAHPTHAEVTEAALPANIHVVAAGLNQPRKITIGPDGNLLVTEAGVNNTPSGCVDGNQPPCANPSGAIVRITPGGHVTTVVSGLPSISPGNQGPGASGPSGITMVNGKIQFIIQNADINAGTGLETFGPGGDRLGDLISTSLNGGALTDEANLGLYEAEHNPDSINYPHGMPGGPFPAEPTVDSDPYGVTPYDGGLAIADAAANDVLLYKDGHLSTLAVLPLIPEVVPANALGPDEPPTATRYDAQAVPTSVTVGPNGELYIGELGGADDLGVASVYRLAGGHLTKVAGGFTMVGDIAFDQSGRLLVMEVDQKGLFDPGLANGTPAPGAIIRVNRDGSRTTLASTGLIYPGGIAVAKDGSIYATNFSVLQGHNDPYYPASGEVVRIADSNPFDDLGANYGGYREVAKDGGVFTFGSFGFYGSEGGTHLNAPVVGGVSVPLGPGYWEVASDGGIFTFGTAGFYGSTGAIKLNKPIVGMAPTPDGRGYYLFASDGGVFTFGDASYHGSLGAIHLNKPIIGGAVTADGRGYYLFASDGGVFTFGDARFRGSEGAAPLVKPIVTGAVTPDGGGYYLVAADGGVFTFGDATYHGSLGGQPLNAPIVSMSLSPNNEGYNLVASDGGVFNFGNAVYYGSEGGHPLVAPVVSFG